MEETISSELNRGELSRLKFRHTINELQERASSVLTLTLQWKEIEDHFSSTRNKIEERAKELRLADESVARKLLQAQSKEKEFEEFVNVRFTEIEEREKGLELVRKREVEERRKEIEKIEKSRKEIEEVKELADRRLREVNVIENQKLKELNEIEKQCEWNLNELMAKEKQLEERRKQLESEDSKFRERIIEFERRSRELELKEKLFVDSQFTHVKIEQSDGRDGASTAKDNTIDANINFCVSMDGIALQRFLNERSEDLGSMEEQVFMALGFSSNPAKLVLYAMQGFYPPHLKKGDDLEFEEAIARKSCIFLLEILMRLKPEISPDVKQKAVRLAFDWMGRMKRDYQHSVEVLGCLQLLASYRLASAFDADELLKCLEIVAHYRQSPELLRILGLANRISGFVQNLITKNKKTEAIEFIHAFELAHEFPPVDLLDEFLNDAMSALNKSSKRHKPITERIEATRKVIDNMKAALRCIEDYKIESKLSTKHHLEQHIRRLEIANASRKAQLPIPSCKSQSPSNKKICFTSKVVAAAAVSGFASKCKTTGSPANICSPTTLTISPAPTQSQKKNANKRPWSAVSAKDDQNAFVGSASAVSSIQLPHQQPAKSSADEDFIRGLIESNQRIEAIKNIYRLKMVDKFSPVNLLRDHLIYVKNVDKPYNYHKAGPRKQIRFLSRKITELNSVLNCIATYSLESEFPPKNLQEHVARFKREMASKRLEFERTKAKRGPFTGSKDKTVQQQEEEKQSPNHIAPSSAPASVAASVSVTSLPNPVSVTPIINTCPLENPRNHFVAGDYCPQPAGHQYTYYNGAPSPSLSRYPPSNAYGSVNPYHRWDARRPPNSGYYFPPPPWRPAGDGFW